MLEWYNNYSIPLEINDDNIEIYVNLLLKNNNLISNDENIIENKVNQIEIDYEIQFKKLEEMCYDQDEINKFLDKNSLLILQKELEIIKLLTKYALQNNQLNYKFFLACLKFLLFLSEILRKRLDQKEIIHETKIYTSTNIPRCSYKFCNYKDNCVYNYNTKNKSLCYQDHYVHRMVSADLTILIDYITQKYSDENTVIHNKEILKTINTLSFVINHMENELRAKCLYLNEDEYETCHFVKYK
jgi:hypothetical protein